jgi:hypothetical protein
MWEFDEKYPKQVSAYGLRPGLSSAVPAGHHVVMVVLTQTLKHFCCNSLLPDQK